MATLPQFDIALEMFRFGGISLTTLASLSTMHQHLAHSIAASRIQKWIRPIIARARGSIRDRVIYHMSSTPHGDFIRAVISRVVVDNALAEVRDFVETTLLAAEYDFHLDHVDSKLARKLLRDVDSYGSTSMCDSDLDFRWIVHSVCMPATPMAMEVDLNSAAVDRLAIIDRQYTMEMTADYMEFTPGWVNAACSIASRFGAARDLDNEIEEAADFLNARMRRWPIHTLVSLVSEDYLEQLTQL